MSSDCFWRPQVLSLPLENTQIQRLVYREWWGVAALRNASVSLGKSKGNIVRQQGSLCLRSWWCTSQKRFRRKMFSWQLVFLWEYGHILTWDSGVVFLGRFAFWGSLRGILSCSKTQYACAPEGAHHRIGRKVFLWHHGHVLSPWSKDVADFVQASLDTCQLPTLHRWANSASSS